MEPKKYTKESLIVATAVVLVAALAMGPGLLSASADHMPANKSAVGASTIERMTTQMGEGSTSEEITILDAQFRTPNNADLAYQLTLECALLTEVTVIGNDESRAMASVKIWIEVDGEPVRVSSDEDPEDDDYGKVVFCNRDYELEIQAHQDEEAMFRQFMDTRSANAFTWIHQGLGNGVHDLEVKAQLEANVHGMGNAHALIGKRTLHVEPIQLPNDVEF